MVQEAFNRAFRHLVGAFSRYHDTPRSPDTVSQLGAARIELEDARSVTRRARQDLMDLRSDRRGPAKQTGVGDDDLARLRVLGSGFVQG